MEYFKSPIHLLFLMKQLQELDRLEILEEVSDGVVAADGDLIYDTIYDAAFRVIDGLFDISRYYYNDDKGISTCVLTDKVIADYYLLSEEYGIRYGLPNIDNPYFKEANGEAQRWFDFSFSLAWFLEHRPESVSPFKTKLVIFWDENYDLSMIGVAIGVAGIYGFFREKRDELISLLSDTEKEAAAA